MSKTHYLTGTIILVTTVAVIFGVALHDAQSKLAELTQSQVEMGTLKEQVSKHEGELERIHGMGFDQGYRAAIWDTYFNTPNYYIQEEAEGISLWKKQDIEPEITQHIQQIRQDEEVEAVVAKE